MVLLPVLLPPLLLLQSLRLLLLGQLPLMLLLMLMEIK
jgi:hypothetical protein